MKLHSSTKKFTPAPEGVFDAICVDVVDLGMVSTQWGDKPKLRIVWEISEKMEDGRNFLVMQTYGASLHEKSNLRKHLKTWRGRDFTKDELEEFDLENLISAPCQLVITHNENEGTVYANVQSVLKAGKSKLSASGKYKRVKDREENKGEGVQEDVEENDKEDVPFLSP